MPEIKTIKPFNGLRKYTQWASLWADPSTVDILGYVSEVCHPEDCLVFCRLLLPDFTVAKGGVFLSDKYSEEGVEAWIRHLDGDMRAVERVVNHTHMYDVFACCKDDVEDIIYLQLAEIIAVSWRLVLKQKIPDRDFIVNVSNTDQDYGPTIELFQVG
ncbi:hypothetical protein [Pseudomonas sp. NPDC089406]|uniref:hypothetical protein n=1 Tax=Pseudomonas sp. NPDC089406 TaxID=3364463 RepID=UPI00384A507D